MNAPVRRSFCGDNNAPVAPEMVSAILEANAGDALAYGEDPWTARAIERFRRAFGERTDVLFTFNGTGANVVALSSLLRPWEAVLAPATAHLYTDECGALERFCGSKIIPIATADGKLRIADLEAYALTPDEIHFAQPRVVSISQATEFGGVYEAEELRELCAFCHERGLLVHLDGARVANAAVALGTSLREITADAGVDVLSFGGTKNGLLAAEAVCFFNPELHAGGAAFVQKQAMQLASKMRYAAAQFDALLAGDLWARYAGHANAMAARLQERVSHIPGIRVTRPVRCNAVFATLDRSTLERVRERYYCYVFDEALPEVRWMTHWATTPQDVDEFAAFLEQTLERHGRA